MTPSTITLEQRVAEKEASRKADVWAECSGEKAASQLKREAEVFAFPKTEARINLQSAVSLF